ncbi:helicase associated domain-containing protein [Frankia sp. AiPs1]|uniref:helicase associated domain-containing protein n=1 Tax=Frankia sp. AiPs1 TaxID=573493 RepID=UPI002042F465|nr:helicase associated domain-containing protein [Frankia sp. AiPs1]MCM3920346.1 helicase associated domain-containing protein [Frankia sp. AiPs1]
MTDHADSIHNGKLQQAVGHLSTGAARTDAVEFERGVTAIIAFAGRHGHTRPSDGYRDESGFPLAAWVARQREAYLENRLADERRAALDCVDCWDWIPAPAAHHHRGGEHPEEGP